MACNITLDNIGELECATNNLGGLRAMYIVNRERKDYFISSTTDSYRKSQVDVNPTYATDAEKDRHNDTNTLGLKRLGFKRFSLIPELSNYTSTINKSNENNSLFVTTEVNLVFYALDLNQYTIINNILKGDFVVILEGNNGKSILVGNDQPIQVSGGNLASGTAYADGVQLSVQLRCNSKEVPRLVSMANFKSGLWPYTPPTAPEEK